MFLFLWVQAFIDANYHKLKRLSICRSQCSHDSLILGGVNNLNSCIFLNPWKRQMLAQLHIISTTYFRNSLLNNCLCAQYWNSLWKFIEYLLLKGFDWIVYHKSFFLVNPTMQTTQCLFPFQNQKTRLVRFFSWLM